MARLVPVAFALVAVAAFTAGLSGIWDPDFFHHLAVGRALLRGASFAIGVGLVAILAYLGFAARDVLFLVFLALLLGAGLEPVIGWIRTRLPLGRALGILERVDVAVLRGNAGEIATLAGIGAEVRGVESIGADSSPAELARKAAAALDVVASVTGPIDYVSDGERVVAVENGHPLLASITGTGCMSSAVTGAFLAVNREEPLEAVGGHRERIAAGHDDVADLAVRGDPLHRRLELLHRNRAAAVADDARARAEARQRDRGTKRFGSDGFDVSLVLRAAVAARGRCVG